MGNRLKQLEKESTVNTANNRLAGIIIPENGETSLFAEVDTELLNSVRGMLEDPKETEIGINNARFFSHKLGIPITNAYQMREALGRGVTGETLDDNRLSQLINKYDVEEYRAPRLEVGPEKGFMSDLWDTVKYDYINKKNIEGDVVHGPFVGRAFKTIDQVKRASDNEGMYRKEFVETVSDGFDTAGMRLQSGLTGKVQQIGDLIGSKKLSEWGEMMALATDQWYAENPDKQIHIKPGTGVVGTTVQAIRRPEIIVQSAVEMVPMVLEATLGHITGTKAASVVGKGAVALPAVGRLVGIAEPIVGANYSKARKNNVDIGSAFAQSYLQGYGEAALEDWSLKANVKIFKGAAGKAVRKGMAKKTSDILLAGGKVYSRGFTEEASQSVNERFWELIFTDQMSIAESLKHSLTPEALEAGAIGGIMETLAGGSSASAGKVAQSVMLQSKKHKLAKTKKLREDVNNNETLDDNEKAEINSFIDEAESAILDDVKEQTMSFEDPKEANEAAAEIEEKANELDMEVEVQGREVIVKPKPEDIITRKEPVSEVPVVEQPLTPEEQLVVEAKKLPKKAEPVKPVEPTIIVSPAQAGPFKKTFPKKGEFPGTKLIENPEARRLVQGKENQIATLKTRLAQAKADAKVNKATGVTQAKANAALKAAKELTREIERHTKEITRLKERSEVKLVKSMAEASKKLQKFKDATEFKKGMQNEALSMIQAIDKELQPAFIKDAFKADSLKKVQNLGNRIEAGINRWQRRNKVKEVKSLFKNVKPKNMRPEFGKPVQVLKDLFTTTKPTEETIDRRSELLDFAKAALTEAKRLNPDSVTVTEANSLVSKLELESGKFPIASLPLAEMQEIIDIITSLDAMNKQEGSIISQRDANRMETRRSEIEESISQREKPLGIVANFLANGHGNLESISDNISGGISGLYKNWASKKNSLTEYIYDVINQGVDAQYKQASRLRNKLRKIINKHNINPVDLMRETRTVKMEDVNGNTKQTKFSTAELLSIFMHSRNIHNLKILTEQGMNRNVKGVDEKIRGFTRGKIDELTGLLTKDQKQFARDIGFSLMDGMNKATVNQTSLLLEGREIATVDNYWPAQRKILREVAGEKPRGVQVLLEGMGFLKERTGTGSPLNLKDFFTTVYETNKNVASYKGLAPALRDVKGTWTSEIRDKYDNAGWTTERKVIDDFIRNVEGRSQELGTIERKAIGSLAYLRTNFAKSVFGINVKVWARQQLSSLLVKSYVEARYLKAMRGVSTPELLIRIKELSPQMAQRFEAHRYDRDIGDAVLDSEFHDYLTGDGTFESLQESWENKDVKGFLNKTQLAFLAGMKYFDTNAIADLFRVAEAEIQGNNPSLKEGSKEYNKLLKDRFEWLVRHTQPVWHVKDRSQIGSTVHEGLKHLTMFMSQREQIVRMVTNAAINYKNSSQSREDIMEYANVIATVGTNIALFTAYNLAWAVGIAGADKDIRDVMTEFLSNVFGNVFGSRLVTEIFRKKNGLDKGKYVKVDVNSGPISLIEPGLEGSAYLLSAAEKFITGQPGWEDRLGDGIGLVSETAIQGVGLPYAGPKNIMSRINLEEKQTGNVFD